MANEFVTRNGLISLGGETFPYKAVTTTYAIGPNDNTIDCTSGTFNVTLPTAVGIAGKRYIVKNSGAGTITLNTTSSQTIDGTVVRSLSQYDSFFVESNGANWIIAVVAGGTGGGITTNSVTFDDSGSGDASGTSFDGSTPRTVSYNTLGANKVITSGTAAPSGGVDGDIYLQYV